MVALYSKHCIDDLKNKFKFLLVYPFKTYVILLQIFTFTSWKVFSITRISLWFYNQQALNVMLCIIHRSPHMEKSVSYISIIQILSERLIVSLLNLFFFFSSSRHALIIFGGVQGLELSLETDEELLVSDPGVLFDHYINVCPDQGSRTIRTEVITSLSLIRSFICCCCFFKIIFFKHLFYFI